MGRLLKIFHGILPKMCKDLDPERLYWPSSPGYTTKIPDNNQIYGSGDNHYWGVWHVEMTLMNLKRILVGLFQNMVCNLFQKCLQ